MNEKLVTKFILTYLTSKPDYLKLSGKQQRIAFQTFKTIMTALQSTRNREQAAKALGISTRTLRHKLQRLREEGMSVTRAYAR